MVVPLVCCLETNKHFFWFANDGVCLGTKTHTHTHEGPPELGHHCSLSASLAPSGPSAHAFNTNIL